MSSHETRGAGHLGAAADGRPATAIAGPGAPDHHDHHADTGLNTLAASATLHCLAGCALGEIAGLMIGTALGLSTVATLALAVGLAFTFGYALSTLPLLGAGLGLAAALPVVLAADTLSIAVMELVDNAVMAVIPGAMDEGLVNPVFWAAMMLALGVAFVAAYPVNRVLLARGKGHALTHEYHHGAARFTVNTTALVTAIAGLLLGGLLVSVAAETDTGGHGAGHAAGPVAGG